MKNIGIKEILEQKNKEFYKSDAFLGKDILTIANQINSSRNLMLNSQLEQFVVLEEPEVPRIFTSYEYEVGKYSTSYYQNDVKKKIIAKISKFENNSYYILVTQDETGKYDVIHRTPGEELTESYAYLYNNDIIDKKEVNDEIEEDEKLFHSVSFDKYGNYRYGVNANVCYMIEDNTTEDAIIVSESFANRVNNYYIKEVEVNINNNDIMCNLYGDNDNYKTFPDIGEYTNGRILLARRRINYETALYDLQNENLRSVNYNNDTAFYANGKVIDIQVRSNRSDIKLAEGQYNSQVVKYIHLEYNYYKTIIDTLKPIIENEENEFSNELSYLYKQATDFINVYEDVRTESKEKNYRWELEGSEFDNYMIIFKVLVKDNIKVGSKLSNRMGN